MYVLDLSPFDDSVWSLYLSDRSFKKRSAVKTVTFDLGRNSCDDFDVRG
jgi:hypothetical protein